MTPFTNQILRTLRQKERSTIHLHRPERVHAHGKPISRANLRIYQRLPYYLIRFIPHYILPVIPFHIVIPLIYRADLWCSVRLAVVRKWVFGGAIRGKRSPSSLLRDWRRNLKNLIWECKCSLDFTPEKYNIISEKKIIHNWNRTVEIRAAMFCKFYVNFSGLPIDRSVWLGGALVLGSHLARWAERWRARSCPSGPVYQHFTTTKLWTQTIVWLNFRNI